MDTCLAGLNDITIDDVNSCFRNKILINIGHSYSLPGKCDKIFSNTDTVLGGRYKIMDHQDDRKGGSEYVEVMSDQDTFRKWLASIQGFPELVSYNLKPLHQLVSDSDIRRNLREAIITYMKHNDINRSTQPKCSDCCPKIGRKGRGRLRVYNIHASDLYGDIASKSESYVTFKYGSSLRRTDIIVSDYPSWNNEFYFYDVPVGSKVFVNVYDVDPNWEDHLGGCNFFITAGSYLYTCKLNDGKLYFDSEFKCDKHLTGEYCEYYNYYNP